MLTELIFFVETETELTIVTSLVFQDNRNYHFQIVSLSGPEFQTCHRKNKQINEMSEFSDEGGTLITFPLRSALKKDFHDEER